MKKIIFALAFLLVLGLACYEDDGNDITGYLIKYEVNGNCPIVYIENEGEYTYDDFFYTLDEGVNYSKTVNPGLKNGEDHALSLVVYKHTGDATTVTANIYVNDVLVATQTSSAAYAQVSAKYTIRN